MFKSISGKITMIICLLIIAILFVVNFISYQNTKKEGEIALRNLQLKTLFDVKEMYKFYSNNKQKVVEEFSKQIAIDSNSRGEYLTEMLKTIQKANDFDLFFVGFEDTGLLHRSNGVINGIAQEYDLKNRIWYKEAKKAGKLIISKPYKSASSGKLGITYAAPIYKDGKFIGVVGGDYDLERFSNEVLALGKSATSYAAVFNYIDAYPLLHEKHEKILKNTKLSQEISNTIKANPKYIDPSNDELFTGIDAAGIKQVIGCSKIDNSDYVVCGITKESLYSESANKLLIQQIINGVGGKIKIHHRKIKIHFLV